MLDKSIPHHSLLMTNNRPHSFPIYPLLDGYSFVNWQPGLEEVWSLLQHESGQLESQALAHQFFEQEFSARPDLLAEQCFFVKENLTGEHVATASLWPGGHFGASLQRVHWVTVRTDQQGLGLAKALMTRLMQCHQGKGYSSFIYLSTQTWSYKAINLYAHFGFRPYFSPQPPGWYKKTADFAADAHRGWQLVRQKLGERIEPCLLARILQAGP